MSEILIALISFFEGVIFGGLLVLVWVIMLSFGYMERTLDRWEKQRGR